MSEDGGGAAGFYTRRHRSRAAAEGRVARCDGGSGAKAEAICAKRSLRVKLDSVKELNFNAEI